MGFRTVKINNRCKLETSLGYLVCRSETETRILLDEINILIIENQQVCLTAALLASLIEHKVRVVFCDSLHNPAGELMPYASCFDSPAKIKKQLSWSVHGKDITWKRIVKQKIFNQASVLKKVGKNESHLLLMRYYDEVTDGDQTNREGLAAKTYFSALFGNNFERRDDSFAANKYLNYGYSLLLSSVNRAISIYGYLPMVGIHHKGSQNPFNLGCDIVEPFRPFLDSMVIGTRLNDDNFKKELTKVLSNIVLYDGKNTILDNAISFYVLDVLKAVECSDPSLIKELVGLNEQL